MKLTAINMNVLYWNSHKLSCPKPLQNKLSCKMLFSIACATPFFPCFPKEYLTLQKWTLWQLQRIMDRLNSPHSIHKIIGETYYPFLMSAPNHYLGNAFFNATMSWYVMLLWPAITFIHFPNYISKSVVQDHWINMSFLPSSGCNWLLLLEKSWIRQLCYFIISKSNSWLGLSVSIWN